MSDHTGAGVVLFSVAFLVYFLPAMVAAAREHRNGLGIFILNLFLGWLLIPWVIALVWAVSAQERKASQQSAAPPPDDAPFTPSPPPPMNPEDMRPVYVALGLTVAVILLVVVVAAVGS